MIVRLMGEGQYRVSDDLLGRLNEVDARAAEALEKNDEDAFRSELDQLAQLVQGEGERLEDADLSSSDLIIPPTDLSLEEGRELFSGEGLIPDLPVAEASQS